MSEIFYRRTAQKQESHPEKEKPGSLSERIIGKLLNLAKASSEIGFYVESHPNFDWNSFTNECLDPIANTYGLSAKIIQEIKRRIKKVMAVRDRIEKLTGTKQNDQLSDKLWQVKLFEDFFHFSPNETVEVRKKPTHLTFIINSYEDYFRIFERWENRAYQSAGRASPQNRIPYTVLRNDLPYHNFNQTDRHEDQHIANNIIFGDTELEPTWKNIDDLKNKSSGSGYSPRSIVDALSQDMSQRYAKRIKDEIIAYLKGGTKSELIIKTLTGSKLYDYLQQSDDRKNLREKLRPLNLFGDNVQISYETEIDILIDTAYKKSLKQISTWVAEAEEIKNFLPPTAIDHAIPLLAATPIYRWKTIVDMFARVRRQDFGRRAFVRAEKETDKAIDDLTANYIKYENDELDMDRKLYKSHD